MRVVVLDLSRKRVRLFVRRELIFNVLKLRKGFRSIWDRKNVLLV